jgi:hypothetical protein
MNIKEKRVELRSSRFTTSNDSLQMGADFVSAFAMGFDMDDAIALLRLDSLYIQSFDIKDVRQTLGQDALGRAIGRIAGKDGVCCAFLGSFLAGGRRDADGLNRKPSLRLKMVSNGRERGVWMTRLMGDCSDENTYCAGRVEGAHPRCVREHRDGS